jgi:hypothetical protein
MAGNQDVHNDAYSGSVTSRLESAVSRQIHKRRQDDRRAHSQIKSTTTGGTLNNRIKATMKIVNSYKENRDNSTEQKSQKSASSLTRRDVSKGLTTANSYRKELRPTSYGGSTDRKGRIRTPRTTDKESSIQLKVFRPDGY